MTNHEARPYLVQSYEDMRSPGFDEYLYTDAKDFGALRWVMERGIDLRGFRLEVGGERNSGTVLCKLMNDGSMVIAEYYMARGKLGDVNACLV